MPVPMELNQVEIDKTAALFKRAESLLKNAEHHTNIVFIPSINELRYAGYHLVRYLSEGEEDDLRSSQKHCKRAIYDAAEGPLLKYLSDLAKFQDDYSLAACTTEVIPNYLELLMRVQSARNIIDEAKPTSREVYFELVEPHLITLKEIAGLFEKARPIINKRMRRDRNISC